MRAHVPSLLFAAALGLAAACGGSNDDTLYAPTDAGADGVAGGGGSGGSTGGSGGAGGGALTCVSDKDCTPLGLLCLKSTGQCVQCLTATDCGANADCVEHRCVARCVNSLDCDSGLVCDIASGRCVECVVAADCGANQQCVSHTCRDFCDSDNDCTPQGMLCDFATGTCYVPGTGGTGGSAGSGGTGATGGSGGSGATGGSGGSCGVLNAVVLFDASGSMGSGGASAKYPNAVSSFVAWAGATSGVRTEVMLHPQEPATPPPTTCATDVDCGQYGPCFPGIGCAGAIGGGPYTSCFASDYTATVPLTALPGGAASIQTALDPNTVTPGGGSPHAAVLEAGLGAARGIATQRPSDTTIVVLMVDGEPTGCNNVTWTTVAQIAAQGLASTPSIPTHVIAISADTTGFDEVAYAGGTAFAVKAADAAVGNAMAQIVSSYPCP